MSGRGIRQVRKQVGKLERVKHWMPAKLGDGAGNVKVTGKNNAVWVRVAGHGTPVIAYNYSGAANAHNLPVLVGKDDNVLVVKKFNMRGGWDPAYNPTVPPHANNHTWGGPDVVFLDTKQIMPLSVYVSSGMVVAIVPGVISSPTGVVKVNSTTVTLTAPVSQMRFDLIQVDLTTGAVSAKNGSAFDLEDYSLSYIPVPDGGSMGIAAVRLYTGQTAISNNFTDPDIIDLRFPSMTTGGGEVSALYHNYVLLYHVNTITAYAPTEAGLTAALGASADGDTITIPAYGFTDDFTVPAGVTLMGLGNESIIYGTVTMADESWLQNLKVTSIVDDATTAICIEGPASGLALLWHVSLFAANTSTGDAICINCNGGAVTVQTGALRAQYTDGSAHSWIVYSSGSEVCGLQFTSLAGSDSLASAAPANWKIAEGATAHLMACLWHASYTPAANVTYAEGDRSAIDHTHAAPDYPGLDVIALYHAGAVTSYDSDETGLADALTASASGDIVIIPTETFTDDFTLPDGVTLIGGGTKSEIAGVLTVGDGCDVIDLRVHLEDTTSDTLIAIQGPDTTAAEFLRVSVLVKNLGTGNAYCAQCNGVGLTFNGGTLRAEAADGGADARIVYSTGTEVVAFQHAALAGGANLGAAAPANWLISEGAVPDFYASQWHAGFVPAAGTYADGDRSDITHDHGGLIDATGFHPPSLADAAAPNNTVYYSTTASKLVYKDGSGNVQNLY